MNRQHAWSTDPARDAAVRAEEDKRTEPLPTLEEAISAAFTAGVKESARKVEDAWAMIPKSVSASFPVEPENKEQSMRTDGLWTDRVTLEITYDQEWCDEESIAERASRAVRGLLVKCAGESVRVVSDEEREGEVASLRADVAKLANDKQFLVDRLRLLNEAIPAAFDDNGDRTSSLAALRVLIDERNAAIRERDDLRKSWLRSEESGTRLLAERNAALDAADVLRKRVAELEAASGGGEQEPVAWGFTYTNGSTDGRFYNSRASAEEAVPTNGTVVPLYRSPPPPRGWLTEEERELLTHIVQHAADSEGGAIREHDIEREVIVSRTRETLAALLARSTPPEVVLPERPDCSPYADYGRAWRDCLEAVRSSLDAAGVPVKEVGRD